MNAPVYSTEAYKFLHEPVLLVFLLFWTAREVYTHLLLFMDAYLDCELTSGGTGEIVPLPEEFCLM